MPVRVTGLDEAIAEHERLMGRALDLSPFLEGEAERVRDMIDDAWASRVSPGGDAWPASSGDGGSGELRSAHRVEVSRSGYRIRVPVRHASYQFFGTRAAPGRNPLPVEPRGGAMVWVSSGRAGSYHEEMLQRLRAYLSGKDGDDGR